MRALPRYFVASLVVAAAAALFAGGPVHFAAASVAHPSIQKVLHGSCPAGTNWDDVLHLCM